MKKNRMMRLASILLVCVLLTTSVISGTFAKYTTAITATDSARVAKFDVSAFGLDATQSNNQATSFNIFEVSKVYDTYEESDFTDGGTNDVDIKDADDTTPIIAPGSWGTFNFVVENDSEVNVTYAVDYTVNEEGVPLEWSINGSTWTDDLADVTATALNMGSDATITIYWRWAFVGAESNHNTSWTDSQDTDLGFGGTAAPSVQIVVTITQVD